MVKVERRVNYVLIGRRLKQARKKAKMTQAEVAELIHVKAAYYSNLERGRDYINLERLIQLCIIFQILPGDLLNECCAELMPMKSVDLTEKSAEKDDIIYMVNQCSKEAALYMRRACKLILEIVDHGTR